jgi:hypothetical protein
MAADPVKHSLITLSIGSYLDGGNWALEIKLRRGPSGKARYQTVGFPGGYRNRSRKLHYDKRGYRNERRPRRSLRANW